MIDMFHALLSEMRASIAQCDDARLPVGYAPCVQLIQPEIKPERSKNSGDCIDLYRNSPQIRAHPTTAFFDTAEIPHGLLMSAIQLIEGKRP
ncbi:hypothetical protein [Pseudomonas sp. SWRI179]|uniref:hypothetical protein n=1 Tax=Pseudomonas sp. SWRI179 TaxID=2745497 RepID=UPI0016459C1D|nr:hypothetical protein [Pseudomonas sp. SWRI179]MBC3387530.1 hypothetical protein [Pseudomonas sp. SWRI179]